MSLLGSKLKRLTSGPPGLVRTLNDIIDRLNDLRGFTGDGRYIAASNVGGTWAFRWIGPRFAPGETKFLAHITASALQAGHAARWNYTFAEVELTPTGYQAISGGRTGTAENIIERSHIAEPSSETAWYVWGVNVHGANYPAGFGPRPVGGGGTSGTHKVNQPVEITERTDSEGNTVYTFQGWGSHDGGCSA